MREDIIMRDIALLLLILGALSAGGARSEDGCHATGKTSGEVAVCGDTGELDRKTLESAARALPPAAPIVPASAPSDGRATGSKPLGPADLENVPKGRRY
jgi:hypothetical protein